MKKHPAYQYSRPLDVLVWSEYPEADAIADKVATIIDDSGLGHKITLTYRKNLRIVLLNLYAAWIEAEELWLGYSRDHNRFAKINQKHPRISAETIMKVIDDMEPVGLIHKAPGVQAIERQSRMTWTDRLASLFAECELTLRMIERDVDELYLRTKNEDSNKNENITFTTSPTTTKICKDVKTINRCLGLSEVTLELTQREKARFREYLRNKKRESVRLVGTKLYRVFNTTSPKKIVFTRGGRWYGHWSQTIPKKYRPKIRINGEAVTEIDYDCFHVVMAYDMIKAKRPDVDDLYSPPNVDVRNRKLCKRLLLTLINAATVGEAHSSTGLYKYENPEVGPFGENTTIPKLSEALQKMHEPISSFLGSAAWGKCQYEDSEIAKRIMLDFAKDNITCLPIHDSFIVAKRHRERLQELMKTIYHDRFGVWPTVGVKY